MKTDAQIRRSDQRDWEDVKKSHLNSQSNNSLIWLTCLGKLIIKKWTYASFISVPRTSNTGKRTQEASIWERRECGVHILPIVFESWLMGHAMLAMNISLKFNFLGWMESGGRERTDGRTHQQVMRVENETRGGESVGGLINVWQEELVLKVPNHSPLYHK